jgi:hypothetical protein
VITTSTVAGVLSTVFLAWSIYPKTGVSFGAGIPGAVSMADELDDLTFRRSQARSMRDAKFANEVYLDARQQQPRRGIWLFAASVLGVVLMIVAGAFVPATSPASVPSASPAPSVAPVTPSAT